MYSYSNDKKDDGIYNLNSNFFYFRKYLKKISQLNMIVRLPDSNLSINKLIKSQYYSIRSIIKEIQ